MVDDTYPDAEGSPAFSSAVTPGTKPRPTPGHPQKIIENTPQPQSTHPQENFSKNFDSNSIDDTPQDADVVQLPPVQNKPKRPALSTVSLDPLHPNVDPNKPPVRQRHRTRDKISTKNLARARGEKVEGIMKMIDVPDADTPIAVAKKASKRRLSDGRIAADMDDPKYTELKPIVLTAFLAAVSVTGRPTACAKDLRLNYHDLMNLRDAEEEFREKWEVAMRSAFEHQEDEVRRRAFDGYKRPVYQMGKLVGHETVYSDALALTMLKAGKPETYNPKTVQTIEHAGAVGAAVAQMTDEQLNEAINRKLRFLGAMPPFQPPQDVEVKMSEVSAAEVVRERVERGGSVDGEEE